MSVKMRNAVMAGLLPRNRATTLPRIPVLCCSGTFNFLPSIHRNAVVDIAALAIGVAIPAAPVTAAQNEVSAAPASLPGQNNPAAFAPVVPRELVLTFAEGEYAEPVTSAVTLSCSLNAGVPAPQGTHPDPDQACAELEKAKASLAGLPKDPNTVCPMIYEPVTVTISGVWDGKLVWERATYGNRCQLTGETGTVFETWPFRAD